MTERVQVEMMTLGLYMRWVMTGVLLLVMIPEEGDLGPGTS